MITKFFIKLFVPSHWEIIKEEKISYKERVMNVLWGDYDEKWSHHQGIRYTLKNQYGDLKFETVMDY